MNTMTLTAYGPWHDGHHSTAWWPVFPIGFGLFWLLVLGGGFYLLSRRVKPGGGAERLLAERYARGEIDEEEYRERLSVLRG
jgi:putative membrane protein